MNTLLSTARANASCEQNKPPAIIGMKTINRYWDRTNKIWTAKIQPGEFYVSTHGEMIVTVLGSCVAACIRDKVTGVGGMNHFMLPTESGYVNSPEDGLMTRYGNWAMEALINEILKQGGRKQYLEVKLFGGGSVVTNMSTKIGEQNAEFALKFLSREQISIEAKDLGGNYPRKIYYSSETGRCRVKTLTRQNNRTIIDRESVYSKKIKANLSDGSVEIFSNNPRLGKST